MNDENKSPVDIPDDKSLGRCHWPPAGMALLIVECVKKAVPALAEGPEHKQA